MRTKVLFLWAAMSGLMIAQDARQQVRSWTAQLSDRSFYGRGYRFQGAAKAARWIAQRYQQLGLYPMFDTTYFQVFTFPFNQVEHVKGPWKLGQDWWVANRSPSGQWSGRLVDVPTEWIEQDPDNVDAQQIVRWIKRQQGRWLVWHLHDGEAQKRWGGVARQLAQLPLPAAGVIVCYGDKLPVYGIPMGEPYKRPLLEVRHDALNGHKRLQIQIRAHFDSTTRSQNVGACLRPLRASDTVILLTAHYDHLGMLDTVIFPGAHDNASGVAMMLALMDTLRRLRFKHNVCAVATGGEEVGLVGSTFLSEHFPVPLTQIRFLLNLDLWGTGDGGLMVVNGRIDTLAYQVLDSLNQACRCIDTLKARGISRASDHWPFQEKGVRTFFLYTLGGNPGYHMPDDTVGRLSFVAVPGARRLLTAFIQYLDREGLPAGP